MNRPESYMHQVDDRPADDRPGEHGASGEGKGRFELAAYIRPTDVQCLRVR